MTLGDGYASRRRRTPPHRSTRGRVHQRSAGRPGDLRPDRRGAEPVGDHEHYHHHRAPHHDDTRADTHGDSGAAALTRDPVHQDLRRPQPEAGPRDRQHRRIPAVHRHLRRRRPDHLRPVARPARQRPVPGGRPRPRVCGPGRLRQHQPDVAGAGLPRASGLCDVARRLPEPRAVQQGPGRRRQPAARLRRRRHQRRQGPAAGPERPAGPDRPDGPVDGRRRDLHRAGGRAGTVQGRHRVRPGQLEQRSTTSRSGPVPTGPRPSASSPRSASPPPTPTAGPRPARGRTSAGSPSR